MLLDGEVVLETDEDEVLPDGEGMYSPPHAIS
jgi:hypothetical protein